MMKFEAVPEKVDLDWSGFARIEENVADANQVAKGDTMTK